MNIVVFEENINPVILKRGYYYYKGGNISEDFEKKGNKYPSNDGGKIGF